MDTIQLEPARTERPARRVHPLVTMLVSLAVLTAVIALSAGGYWLKIFTASFSIALATSGTGLSVRSAGPGVTLPIRACRYRRLDDVASVL